MTYVTQPSVCPGVDLTCVTRRKGYVSELNHKNLDILDRHNAILKARNLKQRSYFVQKALEVSAVIYSISYGWEGFSNSTSRYRLPKQILSPASR